MEIAERIKLLRKHLKLSQEAFGNRIGLKKASISALEKGVSNLTESTAKLICLEFNISYLWLTTGEGPMKEDKNENDIAIEKLSEKYNLDPVEKKLLTRYLKMSEEKRLSFITFLSNLFEDEKEDEL